jgi:hypothetical protein
MTQAAPVPVARSAPAVIPLREVLPWLVLGGAVMVSLLYVIGVDQGATSVFPGNLLHEFVHDGRHILGFPCH